MRKLSSERKIELYKAAEDAMKHSYCPYSGFQVGAALLTSDDKVFTGSNVENAAYGASICAERVAFTAALAAGYSEFTAMMVLSADGAVTPCGICRQFIAEFCSPDFLIMTGDNPQDIKEYQLEDLLPYAFSLNKKSC